MITAMLNIFTSQAFERVPNKKQPQAGLAPEVV
jgi:hypothetical protein